MKKFILMLSLLLASVMNSAYAGINLYSDSQFQEILKSGQSVVLDFHADWCPVCRKQEILLNEIIKSPEFSNLQILKVDFDKDSELKTLHNVTKQSTIVVFKEGHEVARKVGTTSKAELTSLLTKGL